MYLTYFIGKIFTFKNDRMLILFACLNLPTVQAPTRLTEQQNFLDLNKNGAGGGRVTFLQSEKNEALTNFAEFLKRFPTD